MKKELKNFHLGIDLIKKLKTVAKEEGRTQSGIVRIALINYLGEKNAKSN